MTTNELPLNPQESFRRYKARENLVRAVVDSLVRGSTSPKQVAAKILFLALALECESVLFTPQAEIARKLGISRQRVSVAVDELRGKLRDLLGNSSVS